MTAFTDGPDDHDPDADSPPATIQDGGLDTAIRSNGAAFQRLQERYGVPLDFVSIKQCDAILALHRMVAQGDVVMDAALPAMRLQLVALLALQNLLSKSADQHLAARLLKGSDETLSAWLTFVRTEGDPTGLTGVLIPPKVKGMDDPECPSYE